MFYPFSTISQNVIEPVSYLFYNAPVHHTLEAHFMSSLRGNMTLRDMQQGIALTPLTKSPKSFETPKTVTGERSYDNDDNASWRMPTNYVSDNENTLTKLKNNTTINTRYW